MILSLFARSSPKFTLFKEVIWFMPTLLFMFMYVSSYFACFFGLDFMNIMWYNSIIYSTTIRRHLWFIFWDIIDAYRSFSGPKYWLEHLASASVS